MRPAKTVHSHRYPPWDALDPLLLPIECPAKTLIRPCVCRGGGVGAHYISMGRDVPTKGILVWDGGVFHCKKCGKRYKYTCPERGWGGVGVGAHVCLERGS